MTINVVTKRGTNQFKGSARFLYASASWQSSNTPQESLDQGLQTNSTRYIREYGGDLGGPILQDRLWLWAAGSRQDISLNPATFSKDEVPYPQTTILEPWSAKLNAQISNANSAALYYQRSGRLEYGVGAAPDRPPETRTNDVIPTDFYKIEDSQRLLLRPLRIGLRELPERQLHQHTDRRPRQGRAVLRLLDFTTRPYT